MRRFLRAHPVTLAVLLLAAALLLLLPPLRTARAEDELREAGWLIEQGGKTMVFPYNEQWRGSATQTNFTVENRSSGIRHIFYGTFRVLHRER